MNNNVASEILDSLKEDNSKSNVGIEESEKEPTIEKLLSLEKLELIKLDTKLKSEELEGAKQDRKQRQEFSNKIFYFLCIFEALVLGIVIGVGAKLFVLSDNVLIAFITTATANVIGIFLLVARYLFNIKERPTTQKNKLQIYRPEKGLHV